ncbi:MAG TPA: CHASE domain-containing protein [Bacteroidales bacterium]|jgi:signal transduction histidine kinase|nr:CHASE domain-containing protein [Bacteroidales bacterium]
MKPSWNFKLLISGFSLKETLVTLGVLIAGLLITAISVNNARINLRRAEVREFEYSANEYRIKIQNRLTEHAQLLRSGVALFSVSDTVTREEWHEFYQRTGINKFLPGIQGFGFTKLIRPGQLKKHIDLMRKSGFPDYNVVPEGKREIYSSIIYLEPFEGSNLRAFGYDMFSEPVRRKAMQTAIDSNVAMLTGKVILVQETGKDVQAGVLMYLPVYSKDMPINTVEERQKAIIGWVYNPYRMRDLMSGILGDSSKKKRIQLKIYDGNSISEESLLYSNLPDNSSTSNDMSLILPVEFNHKRWTLAFSANRAEISIFQSGQFVILVSGIVISLLLFLLSMMQIRSTLRTRQIEQLNEQLAKLNTDKDRFISILSHDLKSPFTAILGFLDLLMSDLRKLSIDDIEHHIKMVYDSARHTFSLLEDLLMWTRAHSGTIPFNPRLLHTRDIYDQVIEVLIPSAKAKNISISYHEDESMHMVADKDMMKAILRNLLSNAIKFTGEGGTVKISAVRENGSVMISVQDSGIGMTSDQLGKLFNITNVLSTAGTGGEKGSGLGLILCKEFVERHGGHIWVSSEPGKGSDFRFSIPEIQHFNNRH